MTNPESKAAAPFVYHSRVNCDNFCTETSCRCCCHAESRAAKLLGRKGGLSRSEAKARAAKENGKKGGAPKKDKSNESSN